MAKKGKSSEEKQPIIIKKVVKKAGGHHGGAWKVAYADFVTAMMAFFLLMWLLNVASTEQLQAVASYFDPSHPKVSSSTSGAGGVLGGLSMSSQGSMANRSSPFVNPSMQTSRNGKTDESKNRKSGEKTEEGEGLSGEAAEEQEKFEEVAREIKQAIQESPELKQLMKNIMVDVTPEGLRIQIVDQEGESMFPSGSAKMYEKTEKLVRKIAEVIKEMPNNISVRGHTDSVPYGPGAEYTNWELSTDRANSCRRALMKGGLPEKRIKNVIGKADTEHLISDKPKDPKNRRISIMLLREKLKPPQTAGGISKRKVSIPKKARPEPEYEKTEGEVYFP